MKKSFLYSIAILITLLFNLSLVSAVTFNCTIQGYNLEYDESGNLVTAYKLDGTKVEKNLTSYFKPKSSAECPTDSVAKVKLIDGGRTLYVENINTGINENNNSPSSSSQNNSTNNYIDTTTQDNYNLDGLVSCGGLIEDIPSLIPKVVSIVYTIIQVGVPIVLVIMGSLDLFKGITAQKEDEIKKGQQIFIKRLIAASLVFFVFVIVKVVISFVADSSGNSIMECADCFLENKCN